MTAIKNNTASEAVQPSRRGLLGMGAFMAAAALPAAAGAQPHGGTAQDRAWAMFATAMEWIDPTGRAAVERARAAGLQPHELYAVVVNKQGWGVNLLFQKDSGQLVTVHGCS